MGHDMIGELAREWTAGRLARGELQPNSAAVEESRLRGLYHCDLAGLDRAALLSWQASIGQLAPATRRAYLSTMGAFCRWLVIEGHLASDPTITLARVREPRRVPRALSATDVALVLAACTSPRDSAVVWLMVGCGLRCVEVSRLDLADYDQRGGTVLVSGKAGHERVLPVPAPVAEAVDRYLLVRGWMPGPLLEAVGSKHLPDGRLAARWISKSIARLMTAAGVHRAGDGRSAHALRHTAASDVLDHCGNVRTVQQMLGHTSLATTEVYLRRASLSQLRKAMKGRTYAA